MMHHGRGSAGRCLLGVSVLFLAGCGEPVGLGLDGSSFSADVRGSTTERITGTASASADPLLRDFATQVTLPDAGTFSVIALSGTDSRMISFSRRGSEFPVGNHRIGVRLPGGGIDLSAFSGGYAVRMPNALRISLADSGSITITEAGSQVRGSFVFYVSKYDVVPIPTPDQVGKPITPIESGTETLTISGSFAALRRR